MSKFLFQPVSPFLVNQKFGDNYACVSEDGTNKVITCDGKNPPPGYLSLYGPKGHLGVDLKAYSGQPVYCACEGFVQFIDANPKSGLDVRIESHIDGEKYLHVYEHLLGHNTMKVGEYVKTGACIGWADNTGYSSGDHLHFELKKWTGNGWVSIDPIPLMVNMFAPNIDNLKALLEKLAVFLEKLVDALRGKK